MWRKSRGKENRKWVPWTGVKRSGHITTLKIASQTIAQT